MPTRGRRPAEVPASKITFRAETSTPSVVAGGFIILPNTIDFNAVFGNIDEMLLDSPVVLSVIGSIAILYILILLWARRQDRKDQDNVSHEMRYFLSTGVGGVIPSFGTYITDTLCVLSFGLSSAATMTLAPLWGCSSK